MDTEELERKEKMLKLRNELLAVEEDRLNGKKGYTVDEVVESLNKIIENARNNGASV